MTGKVALVTGATQGLGLELVRELAQRLRPDDVVYLTGRNRDRVDAAVRDCQQAARAQVRGARLDVTEADGAQKVADAIEAEHAGVDLVINNAVMRVGPGDEPHRIVSDYAEVNNLGTTRIMRAFAPLLRDHGRFVVVASLLGTLSYLAPVLHERFDGLTSLDLVDDAVRAWRDSVADESALGQAWPAFVNIPSKIGQVAAVRALAAQRGETDPARDILIYGVCPGMINTPTSGAWWDVTDAATPRQAAVALLDHVPTTPRPDWYGQLVRGDSVLPWNPASPAADR